MIQNSDRTLCVEQRAQYPDDDEEKIRTVGINEFMQENGLPPRLLQTLIDRMFDDTDLDPEVALSDTDVSFANGLRDAFKMLYVEDETIRLHIGELTPKEMRTAQAVLRWKRREMLAMAEVHVASELPPQDAGGETA